VECAVSARDANLQSDQNFDDFRTQNSGYKFRPKFFAWMSLVQTLSSSIMVRTRRIKNGVRAETFTSSNCDPVVHVNTRDDTCAPGEVFNNSATALRLRICEVPVCPLRSRASADS
jgi:hypothetical protein